MVNIKEAKENIDKLIYSTRDLMYLRDNATVAVRLIFLKYAIDNFTGAKTVEQMQQYANAQKMLAKRNVETGLEAVIPVLKCIDEAYGLDNLLSGEETIDAYASELFGFERTRQKKGTNQGMFADVLELLANLDLEENGDHEVGRVYVDALMETITAYSYRNGFAGEFTTRNDLSRIAKELLNVTSDDKFLDFVAGTGLSTLEITRNTNPTIFTVDKNSGIAAVSAMLYIMYGYDKFTVKCADSLAESVDGVRSNKIFVDSPIAVRVERSETNGYSDAALAVIDKILHNYLENDGIAVMTASSSTLFQSKKAAAGLREELVQLKCLKAVIALPPLWIGSNVGTNLIVIQKHTENNPVFIDAVEASKSYKPEKIRAWAADVIIPDDLVEKIVSVVEHPVDIEGFSHVSNGNEIAAKGFNLIPANYITKPEEEDNITLAEIDAQLKELYTQLLN